MLRTELAVSEDRDHQQRSGKGPSSLTTSGPRPQRHADFDRQAPEASLLPWLRRTADRHFRSEHGISIGPDLLYHVISVKSDPGFAWLQIHPTRM